MQKLLLKTLKLLIIFYIFICTLLYFFQEHLIFLPQTLPQNFTFTFNQPFEELKIKSKDGPSLNALLFKSDSSKGLIFYLHGNAGSLNSWGGVAKTYTDLNYDVFILDYRGYGKSEGSISSQEQLYSDIQFAYDEMKKRYDEKKIIVLGYSIGTGPASNLAATNNPKLLILQAPYYSLPDLISHTYKIIPTFLLKYKFENNEYIKKCKMPIVIFHGNEDNVIYYGSSLKLKEYFKPGDELITLNGQGHNGMTDNPDYILEIQKLLSRN